MQTDTPLSLLDAEPSSVEHEGRVTNAKPEPPGWLIDLATPDPGARMSCRIHGEIDYATTREANEASRTIGPFNDTIVTRINDASGTWSLRSGKLTRFDRSGTTRTTLTDIEVDDFLVETIGYAPQLVAEVRDVLNARPVAAAEDS